MKSLRNLCNMLLYFWNFQKLGTTTTWLNTIIFFLWFPKFTQASAVHKFSSIISSITVWMVNDFFTKSPWHKMASSSLITTKNKNYCLFLWRLFLISFLSLCINQLILWVKIKVSITAVYLTLRSQSFLESKIWTLQESKIVTEHQPQHKAGLG